MNLFTNRGSKIVGEDLLFRTVEGSEFTCGLDYGVDRVLTNITEDIPLIEEISRAKIAISKDKNTYRCVSIIGERNHRRRAKTILLVYRGAKKSDKNIIVDLIEALSTCNIGQEMAKLYRVKTNQLNDLNSLRFHLMKQTDMCCFLAEYQNQFHILVIHCQRTPRWEETLRIALAKTLPNNKTLRFFFHSP